jgi:peptidoglycan/xylan/chitin deacetylase (PgdA/CDA1 family)/N-acetyl-anhydromuramyl-L-alanine amidase AmpD
MPGPSRKSNRPRSRSAGAAIICLLILCASCGSQSSPTQIPTPTIFHPSLTATSTDTATLTPSTTPSPTPESHAGRIPILEYHYTTYHFSDDVSMTIEWFLSQIRWLAENGYTTLSAEQLASFLDGKNIPAKSVVLTFDIGTAEHDDYSNNIIPVLKQYHFQALFFVVTNMINDACGVENKVCWNELKDWSSQGLISVESHGVYHPDYATITAVEQRQDAGTARQIITEKIGRTPIGFAFPYDSFNRGAAQVIESIGYQFALAGNTRTDRSVHLGDADRYHLPRVYPYSNPKIYPVIYGTSGKTFDQLILSDSAVQSAATTTPRETPSGTVTPRASATEPQSYIQFCTKINQMVNAQDRLHALANLPLSTNISAQAQSKLSKPVIFKPSCNVIAGNVPRGIVLHATRGTLVATIGEFQQPNATSAHYIIDRDGQIYQMVPEGLGAFHASCGDSRSGCIPSCPLCERPDGTFLQPYLQSVGIELVNDGQLNDPTSYKGLVYEDYLMSFGYRYWEDYPDAQLQTLVLLVNDIRARWGIPLDLVVGHYRINYKTDPGPALNISWYRSGNPPRAPIFTGL